MGLFRDKKFEELDWISQATEPIESDLNLVLSEMPDHLEIDFDTYIKMIDGSYGKDLSLSRAVKYIISKYSTVPISKFSWDEISAIEKCMVFDVSGSPTMDFKKKQILNGNVSIKKTLFTVDEKDLKNLLGMDGLYAVSLIMASSLPPERFNEIMEMLGNCKEGIRSRSTRNKKQYLIRRLRDLLKNNEWNIKDSNLANKLGKWIASYIETGNLAAMSNFCRLKLMTHKGQPIYSMEEVE